MLITVRPTKQTMSGIGAGGLTPLVSIILNDIVPLEERGLWQGYVNMIWASGSALGAPLGMSPPRVRLNLFISSLDWSLCYILLLTLFCLNRGYSG